MSDQNRDEALRWLRQAENDLAAARTLTDGGFYAQGCFYAQQAGEKALKAALFSRGERPWRVHSVQKLAETCSDQDETAAPLVDQGRLLDRFYIPTRYPNGLPAGTPAEAFVEDDAQQALRAAEAVLRYAKEGV
jgi:HEPN domain-containing protein